MSTDTLHIALLLYQTVDKMSRVGGVTRHITTDCRGFGNVEQLQDTQFRWNSFLIGGVLSLFSIDDRTHVLYNSTITERGHKCCEHL